MARPLTASKSSHRSWFERILLSCDCAMHCGEEVMGVKLHCAICKGPQMYSLMSLRHTALHTVRMIQDLHHGSFDSAAINLSLSCCFSLFESFVTYIRSFSFFCSFTVAYLNVKHCSLFLKSPAAFLPC